MEVVQVSPSYDDDRFTGFVASAGSNEKAFKAAGLREGDVVTMVNGAAKYLADAGSYDRITYAAMNSPYAAGAAEQVAARIVETLRGLR